MTAGGAAQAVVTRSMSTYRAQAWMPDRACASGLLRFRSPSGLFREFDASFENFVVLFVASSQMLPTLPPPHNRDITRAGNIIRDPTPASCDSSSPLAAFAAFLLRPQPSRWASSPSRQQPLIVSTRITNQRRRQRPARLHPELAKPLRLPDHVAAILTELCLRARKTLLCLQQPARRLSPDR